MGYRFRRNGKFITGYSDNDKDEVIHVVMASPQEASTIMQYLPILDEPVDFSSDDFDYMAQHD